MLRLLALSSVGLFVFTACSEYDLSKYDPVQDGANDDQDNEDPDAIVPGEPVADAGDDQFVAPLDTILLDGTGSYDPEGLAIQKYDWTLVSVPPGSTAVLLDTTSARPEFWVDIAGDFVFELTVQNTAGNWDSTPDTVVVTAEPAQDFYVQLTWDAPADLDLHLVVHGNALFSNFDCSYCNMNPSWGAGGTLDDPSLDWDDIPDSWDTRTSYGPETITIQQPATAGYDIKVHYYGQGGAHSCASLCPTTNATVRVYVDGVEISTSTLSMNAVGQVFNVGTLWWPTTQLSPDGTLGYTTDYSCW